MWRTICAFAAATLVATGAVTLTSVPVSAHFVPAPCDFITGGGFIFTDAGAQANFGAHGGCKNGAFWGHVNYVDHGGYAGVAPYHVDSTEITGYLFDPAFPNARDICGFARTNAGENVRFRVRMEDNGEPGTSDRFGIVLSNGYLQTTRVISGGNIQLHKPNPSTTGPNPAPDEFTMCGDLATPEGGGTGGGGGGTTRIEETSSAVTYTGSWTQNYTGAPGGWSGGSVAFSAEAIARATLSFSGTGVSWIGYRAPNTGIANVYLDGTLVATVDTYAPTEQVQAVIYTTSGLSPGSHTLAIEVTGTRNAASSDSLIVVDAFDVTS
jgi:hypothetical protein